MLRLPHVRQTLVHEAMATTFSVRVVHEEPRYARQAMAAAFEEVDRLETQLSRFVEGSDVWRINRLSAGEAMVVTRDTFRCLAAADEIRVQTGGAFDVTYASASDASPAKRLELHPAGCVVRALTEGVQVDLGGIGKGYALDVMAGMLQEWDVTVALLAASTSTILALEPPPDEPGWCVTFGPDGCLHRLELSHSAISGSGIAVKGSHIVDPRRREPAARWGQAWACALTAVQADALSTALMVMSGEPVQAYCRSHQGVQAFVRDAPDGRFRAFSE